MQPYLNRFTINTHHGLRRLSQTALALLCLSIAWQFYGFLQWVREASPEMIPRPAGVEGFLPISALLGLKRLVLTGQWDPVHPAGLTLFIAILLAAWLLRKGFCGHICPVGLISSLLEILGRRMGLARVLPAWADYPLMSLKYLLLAFFLFTAVYMMDLRQIGQFIQSPYNLTADARMAAFFRHPSTTTLTVLGGLMGLSLVLRNVWCRYLCPYGALLGILAVFSPLHIRRQPDTCVNCGRCNRICPGGIRVAEHQTIRSPECIGCNECLGVCPVSGCLSLQAGSRPVPAWILPLGSLAVLAVAYAAARITGHWDNAMPLEMLKPVYAVALK